MAQFSNSDNIKVTPVGKQYRFDQESDIIDVVYSSTGLRVTVIAATSMFTNIYVEVHFPSVSGFRLLDEGDLLVYWDSRAFNSNHHVYEVIAGGWATGETVSEGVLSRNEHVNYREWFINTKNQCMNVLADEEPLIREITNRSISS
jgi:hypothetical protein